MAAARAGVKFRDDDDDICAPARRCLPVMHITVRVVITRSRKYFPYIPLSVMVMHARLGQQRRRDDDGGMRILDHRVRKQHPPAWRLRVGGPRGLSSLNPGDAYEAKRVEQTPKTKAKILAPHSMGSPLHEMQFYLVATRFAPKCSLREDDGRDKKGEDPLSSIPSTE